MFMRTAGKVLHRNTKSPRSNEVQWHHVTPGSALSLQQPSNYHAQPYTYTEKHADVILQENRTRTREEVHSVGNAHLSAILPLPRRQVDTRRGSVEGML